MRTLLITLSIVAVAGCRTTEAVYVPVLRPAMVDLTQYDRVAVDLFNGAGGPELALELSEALSSARSAITGEAGFEVVDRRDLEKTLEDLWRRRGEKLDPKAIQRLEKLGESDVTISGDVQAFDVSETVSENTFIDPTGIEHIAWTRTAVGRISVVIEAQHAESEKMIDRIVYDEAVSGSTKAVDLDPPPIDHASLLDQARANVVGQYVRRVIPHQDAVVVTLFIDGDFPQLKLGNAQLSSGSWDDAIASYRQALEFMVGDAAENRYKALYNLGVALQYSNRFDEARKALQEAYTLNGSEVILQQLQDVSNREEEYRRLQEQGAAVSSAL